MFLQCHLVIENLPVQHITQCAGVGGLESLYVDGIHFHGTFRSEDQAVHGNQYTFIFRFLGGGSDYGIVKIQRAVGT